MNKKQDLARRPLVVHRQTIRVLETRDLGHALGGMKNPTISGCAPGGQGDGDGVSCVQC
jgi:hypothetical protein